MYLTPQAVAEFADVPGSGLVTQAGSWGVTSSSSNVKDQRIKALVALMAVQSDFEALQQLAAAVKHLKDDAKVAAERQMTWHRLALSVMTVHLISINFMLFLCAILPSWRTCDSETQSMQGMQLTSHHCETSWILATAKRPFKCRHHFICALSIASTFLRLRCCKKSFSISEPLRCFRHSLYCLKVIIFHCFSQTVLSSPCFLMFSRCCRHSAALSYQACWICSDVGTALKWFEMIWNIFSQCHALLWRKFDSAGMQVDSTVMQGENESLGYNGIWAPRRRSHFVFGQVPKNAGGYDFIQPGRRSIFVFGQVPKNTGACVLGIRSCFGRLMGRLG